MKLEELLEIIPSYEYLSFRLIDREWQRIYELYPTQQLKKYLSQSFHVFYSETEYTLQELLGMKVNEISPCTTLGLEIVVIKEKEVKVS